MAPRTSGSRSRKTRTEENDTPDIVEDNNVSSEEIEETPVIDETVPENVVDENVDDSVADHPVSDNSADDSAGTNDSQVEKTPVFEFPAKPEDLKLSDPFATAFGQKLLEILGHIKTSNQKLQAASEGDSSTAITQYAESTEASENIKSLFASWSEMKAQLETLFGQLTVAVKTEKGDVQLSPEDIEKIRAEKKKYIGVAKHALVAFKEFVSNNEAAEDVLLFSDTIDRVIGGQRSSAGKTSSGTGSYEQTTSIRPRLSKKGETGGYVQLPSGEKFTSFTPVLKSLEKIDGGKDVTVGQIHTAWIGAALGTDDLSKWNTIPKGTTTKFAVGPEDKPIELVVHTEYEA